MGWFAENDNKNENKITNTLKFDQDEIFNVVSKNIEHLLIVIAVFVLTIRKATKRQTTNVTTTVITTIVKLRECLKAHIKKRKIVNMSEIVEQSFDELKEIVNELTDDKLESKIIAKCCELKYHQKPTICERY